MVFILALMTLAFKTGNHLKAEFRILYLQADHDNGLTISAPCRDLAYAP